MEKKVDPLSLERIKELTNLSGRLVHGIANSPEKGYETFIGEWKILKTQEKELLKPDLTKSLIYFKDSQDATIWYLRSSICAAIINYMNDDLKDRSIPANLTLAKGYTSKQLAKLFYELKSRGIIPNTLEQIALTLSSVFQFKYGTILHYLKNPSEFEKTADIISGPEQN